MEQISDKSINLTIAKKYIHLALIIALIGFVILTWLVVRCPIQKIDLWFSLEVQEHVSGIMDRVMIAISFFGHSISSIVLVVIVSLLFLGWRRKRASIYILFTLCTGPLNSTVKYFVNRPRPANDLVRVIEVTNRQSYPSGHVVFYTVFFGFLIYLMWSLKSIGCRTRILVSFMSIFMVVSISVSRVYLGAHWLTDVLGGYCVGMLCLYGLIYLYSLEGEMI